jgi:ribosomal protein S18 acetylase RimI-like enzyme
MEGVLRTRPASFPEDDVFLLSVYDATRRSELSVLGWPESQLRSFIRMQFDAQTLHFAAHFPDAEYLVVLVGTDRAGRLIVDRRHGEIRIVDISLLPPFRGQGVGTRLIGPLIEEAEKAGLALRCHVAQDNEARMFWEQLGFTERGLDGLHVAMEWVGQTPT